MPSARTETTAIAMTTLFWPIGQPHTTAKPVMPLLQQMHRDDIAADGEKETMSKRQDAEIAPYQVERERQHREGRELTDGIGEISGKTERGRDRNDEQQSGRQHGGQENQEGAIGRQRPHLRRPLTANKPSRRDCRDTIIITRTIAFTATPPHNGSISTFAFPMPRAATTVPTMVPTPPSTTTMKLSMIKF